MKGQYASAIEKTSEVLIEWLMKDTDALIGEGRGLDRGVCNVLREVGRRVMAGVYEQLGNTLVGRLREPGYTVQRRSTVEFKTIFGMVEVESPYLWNRDGRSDRPLLDVFGVQGGGMSDAVDRALVDFGSERSFDRAAKSFHEHYGWEVGRTTVLGHTERAGADAERFLKQRHDEAAARFDEQQGREHEAESILVELDGCEIRTGQYMTAAEAGRSDENPKKVVRLEAWREVRTGLARPLDEVDATYVSAMASYPSICHQLFAAGCERGLTTKTQVIGLADGGQGLREELEVHFPQMQFILDHPHFMSHLYDTAEALGFTDDFRRSWVKSHADRVWDGEIVQVIAEFDELYARTECDRLRQLVGYLTRFRDSVDYQYFRDHNWPIGSGEVESANRYIPQERLKIAGACWHPDTVNPMLALRVVRANNWWNDFWDWRREQDAFDRAA